MKTDINPIKYIKRDLNKSKEPSFQLGSDNIAFIDNQGVLNTFGYLHIPAQHAVFFAKWILKYYRLDVAVCEACDAKMLVELDALRGVEAAARHVEDCTGCDCSIEIIENLMESLNKLDEVRQGKKPKVEIIRGCYTTVSGKDPRITFETKDTDE